MKIGESGKTREFPNSPFLSGPSEMAGFFISTLCVMWAF